MPHGFSQNEHPFGQCGHLSQIEPFEKPWFLVVISGLLINKFIISNTLLLNSLNKLDANLFVTNMF
jgi:hypothetical protein